MKRFIIIILIIEFQREKNPELFQPYVLINFFPEFYFFIKRNLFLSIIKYN